MQTPEYRQGEKPLHEYLREHARQQPGMPADAIKWGSHGRLVPGRLPSQ